MKRNKIDMYLLTSFANCLFSPRNGHRTYMVLGIIKKWIFHSFFFRSTHLKFHIEIHLIILMILTIHIGVCLWTAARWDTNYPELSVDIMELKFYQYHTHTHTMIADRASGWMSENHKTETTVRRMQYNSVEIIGIRFKNPESYRISDDVR